MLSSVGILLVISHVFPVFCQFDSLRFATFLDNDKKYELRWDYNETHIDFEVRVQALGYVGFGISKHGTMTPADLIIGWIIKDQLFFGDYHTEEGSRAPMIDMSTDWLILGGSETEGFTILRFSRRLDTCDSEDEPITPDTMQVIYSYHDVDPNVTSGLVHYHGATRRGSKYILLMESNAEPIFNENNTIYTIDFTNHKYPIPTLGSSRQCIVFNMTGYLSENHLIKYEPILTAGNQRYVYRIMLYRCNLTSPVADGRRYDCENEAPVTIKSCKNMVANWAMGGEAVSFPADIGLPLGGDTEPSIYVLEIHYTNYEYTPGIEDSSGLRLYYTPQLRQYEAGLVELGTVITSGWKKVIPQGEDEYKSQAYCSPRCMNWAFSKDSSPLKIFGLLFQGNDVATKMTLRHFRGAIELPWISHDESYSNFFQSARFLQKPVDILRWDSLVLECQYNTTSRQGITLGGWSRVEEMCRATVFYYPRKSFDMCLGWSSLDQLRNETGQLVPEDGAVPYLTSQPVWDRSTKQRVNLALHRSSERSLCAAINRFPAESAYAMDRYKKPRDVKRFKPSRSSCRRSPAMIPPL